EKLAARRLPDVGGITFTGSGTGQICEGCDSAILPEDMEYAVEARDRRTFRFHVRCVLLWQMVASCISRSRRLTAIECPGTGTGLSAMEVPRHHSRVRWTEMYSGSAGSISISKGDR